METAVHEPVTIKKVKRYVLIIYIYIYIYVCMYVYACIFPLKGLYGIFKGTDEKHLSVGRSQVSWARSKCCNGGCFVVTSPVSVSSTRRIDASNCAMDFTWRRQDFPTTPEKGLYSYIVTIYSL